MRHIGLFEGIGGFSLAARWMGWNTVAWCEWNEFGQKVLKHHFPEAEGYGDITKTDFTKYANQIDIITGGFPCQPFSLAGKRKGTSDERHLWPEMLRAVREIRPSWVVGENVFGIVNWSDGMVFEQVQTDLEAEGYEVWAYVLPACATNAPHRRDRVWFVAYNQHNGNRRREQQQESEQKTNRASENPGSNGCSNGEYDKQISKRNEWEFSTGSKERIFVGEALQNDTNTNCDGCDQCNGNNEKHTSKGRFDALNDIEQIFTTDPKGERGSGLRERKETQPAINGINGGYGAIANTACIRGNEDERGRNGEPNEPYEISTPTDWTDFPTQSPICGRDDGIPSRLVGITFPKHRNESIKAYGNAIVPQVAYQIFKSIEAYEISTTN